MSGECIEPIIDFLSSIHPNDPINLKCLLKECRERKYEALDKFLWAYCQKWREPDVDKEQLKFGDAKKVCNVLAREFLSDIHHVCNQSDDENDTGHLQAYLLKQRGWRILFTMHKLNLQGLSCSRELGTLLVSLLPWCLKFEQDNDPSTNFSQDYGTVSSVEECFSCLSKYTPHHAVHLTRKDLNSHGHKSKTGAMFQRRAEYSVRKSFVKTNLDVVKYSSESDDDANSKSSKRRRYRRYKSSSSKTRSHSLSHYFSQQHLSPFEDGDNWDKILSELIMDPNTTQNPLEFCCLVLDIVKDLCLVDSQPLSPNKIISSTIIPQLLQTLTCPGDPDAFEKDTVSHWSDEDKLVFELRLLHVILTASAMTVGLQNGVNILAGHRIIPSLLKSAERLTIPTLALAEPKMSELCFKFVSHSVLGCLKLIEAVFQYLPFNLTFIRNAVNLMDDFRSHNGFEMLEQVVLDEDSNCSRRKPSDMKTSPDVICDGINVTADVISTLKITKVNYIHTMTCLKKKHRKCQFSQYLDHHHDILGPADGTRDLDGGNAGGGPTTSNPSKADTFTELQSDSTCLVAMLAEFLLRIFPKLSSKQIQVQTLSALYSAGVCCCLSPDLLVDVVIQSATNKSCSVRSHMFEIISRLLLEQLFAACVVQPVTCTVCSADERLQQEVFDSVAGTGSHLVADSGFSSNEALAQHQKQGLSKWKALTKLKQLVFGEDSALGALTMRHLCLLAVKGNSSVKKQLFFNVIFVVFQLFRHKRSDSEESSGSEFQLSTESQPSSQGHVSFPVIHHCLAALPYLLQEDQILNAFLNKKGLQKLCNLVEDNSLRQVVLKVLEALVIFDERRNGRLLNVPGSHIGSRHGSSSSSLQTSLSESSDSIGRLVMKSILNILHSKAKSFCVAELESSIKTNLLMKEGSFDTDSWDSETSDTAGMMELRKLEQFTILTDLWNSCGFLCQKSAGFFKAFLESDPSIASLSYDKLREVMTSLSHFSARHHSIDQQTPDLTKSTESFSPENMLIFKHRLGLAEALLGVCFVASSSPSTESMQKLKQPSELMEFLGEALALCQHLDSIRLKLLFDMLLSCCAILPKTVSRHSQRADTEDDTSDELLGPLASSSGEDSGTFHTEVGYESDSESSYTEPVRPGDHKFSSIPEKDMNDLDPMAPVHRILVDLLVKFKELPTATTLVPYVLQKIVQGIQANKWHADALCSQGCLEELISGFGETLISQNPEDKEKQGLLLEIVQLLAQNEISSQELQLFLQLFQKDQAPEASMLSTLLSIVEMSDISPQHFLTFPVKKQIEPLSPYRGSNKSAQSLRNVGNISALSQTINEYLPWHTYQVAFTLTLWVSVKDNKVTKVMPGRSSPSSLYSSANDKESSRGKRSKTDLLSNMEGECCHVISMGTTEKLFEVWMNLTNGSIILRLTSDMLDGEHILTECDWSGILLQNKWHHLVVMYSEKLDGSTLVGKASLVVDGCDVRDFPLDHPALKVTSKTPSILIGHSIDPTQTDWLGGKLSLGNIMLFKGANFTCDTCFHLHSLGPDNTSISKCDCSNQKVMYSSFLSRKSVLYSSVSHDIMVGIRSVTLTDAQESLIMMYSPKSPIVISLYPHLRMTEQSSVPGNIALPAQSTIMENKLLEQRPDLIPAKVKGQLVSKVKLRLEQSIQQAGGIGIFLYLVAKIFEASDEDSREITGSTAAREQLQATVTRLFLTVLQHMPHLSIQCDEMSGYAMLAKVLSSARSHVGYYTLKTLFDASTTESILRYDRVRGRYLLRKNTEALVRNVQVVEHVLLCWRIWIKAPASLLETLFSGLELLVRGDHPHQEFNIKQFHSIGITQKMFLIYQERLQDGYPSLPTSISQSVINVCRCMMGHPPDSHMIIFVFDFLLIMHPAVNTYVHNQKETYFFNTWWNLPSLVFDKQQTVSEIQVNRSVARTYTPLPLPREEETPQTETETLILRKSASMPSAPLAISRASRNDRGGFETLSSEESGHENDTPGRQRSSSYPPVTPANEATPEVVDSWASVENENDSIVFIARQDKKVANRDPPSSSSSVSEDKQKEVQKEGQEGSVASRGFAHSLSIEEDMTYSIDKDSREEGVEKLCEGLFGLLCEVVENLQDSMIVDTLTKILRPEVLIILVQNQSAVIRLAVLKLLSVYLAKATMDQQESFIKMEGFKLVCNQLHQYPATLDVIELITAMVCAQSVNISVNTASLINMSATQKGALTLLLGLLDKTVGDPTLCQNTLYILAQIFESSPFAAGALLEFGLVETLCNLLAAIHASKFSGTAEQKQLLLDSVHNLMVVTSLREYSTNGVGHYQQFEDILTLLKTLEEREESVYGKDSVEAICVQSVQWKILRRVLEFVERSAEGRDDSVSHFHNTDSVPAFNSFRSLLMPSFLTSRSAKAENNYGNHLPHPPNSSTNQTPAIVSQPPSPAPKASEGFSVQKKLSAVLDFLMDGSDSMFLGTFSGFEEVGMHGMGNNSDYQGAGASSHYSGVMSLDRKLGSKVSTPPVDNSGPTTSWSVQVFSPKKKQFVPVNPSELLDRLKKTITIAVNLVVFAEHTETKKSDRERKIPLLFDSSKETAIERFEKFLYSFLFRALVTTLEKTFFGRKKNMIMWNAKDGLKTQFGRLLTLTLSPKVSFELRRYALSYLAADQHYREILRLLLANHQQGIKIGVYLHELLTVWRDRLTSKEVEEGCKIVTSLRQAGFNIPSTDPASNRAQHKDLSVIEELKMWELERMKAKDTWKKKRTAAMSKISTKYDAMSTKISANASEVTQLVTQLQNVERKKFFDHIKRAMSYRINIKKCWQELIQQLTHERAVWHFGDSAAQSWQLDPTEGPCRVRRRLQRCHLGLEPRFLKKDFQHKIDKEKASPPLIYLFEDDHQTSDSAALIYRLYTNEKIQHTCKCTAVTPANETKGEILIGENCVYFVADEAMSDANYTQVLLGNKDQLSMTWPHVDIREIHKRRYNLQNIALEIFLTNGKTCLLAFESPKERDELVSQLDNMELPNSITMENLTAIQQLWVEGQMTNFEYLTHLNTMSGRSFNDLMQYPVFPFVLKDYVSKSLDLSNPGVFRDLSKPIAVQDKIREQKYVDNYNYLKGEYERSLNDEDSVMYQVTPYHYGSHYSNSGTVLQFLVRLPPFTKMFLSYQDNNFDIPDRTFHSMNTAWRLSSFESTTDVKELIPEFFFLPDFLQNKEGYNFGSRQTGEEVSDVSLPPWCCQDARLFILIHRQALESTIVSQTLHEWLNLVFGYKQQGEMAIKSVNVFHPSTYFGVDVEGIKDPVRRHAMKTMIKTYGQTPEQLFFSPHPPKSTPTENTSIGLEKITQLFTKSPPLPSLLHSQFMTSLISDDTMSPSRQVLGLSWGQFAGSPDSPEPTVIWQQHYDSMVASISSLPTGEVFGIGPNSCLLVMYSKERGVVSMTSTQVVWAAIISWGYPDGVLRIQNKQDQPAVNFLFEDSTNEVCCCASLPDCRLLFTGGSTGVLTVYNTNHNAAKESDIMVMGHCKHLYGHSGAVTRLEVCWSYKILVSASDDHTCIIWDLNRLTYVNSISTHNSPVKCVTVSETLGDIVSVSDEGMGSSLQLHTVNGEPIVSTYCQQTINCLAFSSAPEGRSVNVIAGGLSSGVIRLWSSWDLIVVRDLQDPSLLAKPVISLTFTYDNQRLYMSTSDGTVTVWESQRSNKGKRSPPNFTPFT